MSIRRTSQSGVDLIKQYEGCKLEAYLDGGGVPTIGYGHTKNVKLGQCITESEAEDLLEKDLFNAEAAVSEFVYVHLTSNQYAALVSFVYNIGREAFRTSTLIQRLNRGDYDRVPFEMKRWNKDNGKIVPGLTNRRAAEAALWEGLNG